ncbi:hypothetical protein LPTSP3_g05760 [Leptospira kobayashii]|uniref:Lipoprotein n=1 Tax=Leptospira kobayashii TaxID=1917830 RepID=A0ABN6KDE7_9LEPT|nr:hypothetical protein [Leptospira kobayashii]BDA77646.1 hypothetical protein LPTSP3_g05760 [Leptospira kobayashii]
MNKRYVYISILVSVLTSCAMFREGLQEPKSGTIEVAKPASKSLGINTVGKWVHNNGNSELMQAQFLKYWEEAAIKEGKGSLLFTSVEAQLPKSDYTLDLEVLEIGDPNIPMALLTGLTLYVIPSYVSIEWKVIGTFKKAGKVIGVIEKKEKLTLWQQIFLIFVMPFKFPVSVANETRQDLFFAVYKEANQKGFFK